MTRYIWRDGAFRDKTTGEVMEKPHAGKICKPTVIGDIEEYLSPITWKPVAGRAAQREDLARSGSRIAEPSEFKPREKD